MIAAIILALFALLMGAVVKSWIKTGSLTPSMRPGAGSGRTIRQKHPIFFWMMCVQIIGATFLVGTAALLSAGDALGLVDISEFSEDKVLEPQ